MLELLTYGICTNVHSQYSAQRCIVPVSSLVDSLLLFSSKSNEKESGKTHLCAVDENNKIKAFPSVGKIQILDSFLSRIKSIKMLITTGNLPKSRGPEDSYFWLCCHLPYPFSSSLFSGSCVLHNYR